MIGNRHRRNDFRRRIARRAVTATALWALVLGVMVAALPVSAATIRVSQETSAGAGDFDSNILGFVDSFDASGLTAAGFYSYGSPIGSSYNGDTNGGPAALANTVQHFFVDTTDGLVFTSVMSAPGGSSGNWSMRLDLAGDTMSALVLDEPAEAPVASGGGFNISNSWVSCCTDGNVFGALDGTAWTLLVDVNSFGGISTWQVTDDGAGTVSLALAVDRRVRFDIAAEVAEPGTVAVLGLGLLGLGYAQRRRGRG